MTLGLLLALSAAAPLRAAALSSAAPAVSASTQPAGADAMEALLKQGGGELESEFRVAVPQSELRVTLDGFPLVPAMGLTSWIAFSPGGGAALALGELVLLEDEAGPVQRAALAAGFTVTGLHNHFLREKPKVVFMQVSAHGALDALTDGARKLFAAVSEARQGKGLQSGPTTAPGALDAQALQKIIGGRPVVADGVVKFVVPRPDVALKQAGRPVSSGLGFHSWLAFEGTMEKAAVSGELAVLAGEAEGVERALAAGGVDASALHNHLIGESPAVYFLHAWGVGRAEDLARALKAALRKTGP